MSFFSILAEFVVFKWLFGNKKHELPSPSESQPYVDPEYSSPDFIDANQMDFDPADIDDIYDEVDDYDDADDYDRW